MIEWRILRRERSGFGAAFAAAAIAAAKIALAAATVPPATATRASTALASATGAAAAGPAIRLLGDFDGFSHLSDQRTDRCILHVHLNDIQFYRHVTCPLCCGNGTNMSNLVNASREQKHKC
jgi:hypothetical protein